jgi:hypothetical protein
LLLGPITATGLVGAVAAARLVRTITATGLVGPVTAAWLVRTVAGGAVPRLPVATGAAMWTVGSVTIGSVGAAVWTALIEAHCFKEYAEC